MILVYAPSVADLECYASGVGEIDRAFISGRTMDLTSIAPAPLMNAPYELKRIESAIAGTPAEVTQ